MPADSVLKSEKLDPIPMAAAGNWITSAPELTNCFELSLIKTPPEELMEEAEAEAEADSKTTKPNPITVESKKKIPCICSPTSHAGSFRCHLHRATNGPTHKSSTSPTKLKGGGQPILSRFGRLL